MFNYHGMTVVLPSDNPDMVAKKFKKSNKKFINATFVKRKSKMRDNDGKLVEGKEHPIVTVPPNRKEKRYKEKHAVRKNNKGIPSGFSKKEFGRYQNRFNNPIKENDEQ